MEGEIVKIMEDVQFLLRLLDEHDMPGTYLFGVVGD